MKPTFSVVHTTARPDGWQQSYESYMAGLTHAVEYVLCMDRRWGFTNDHADAARKLGIKVVWNNGRRCMVDGYSYAAAAATGEVLLLNSDDMRAFAGWDAQLLNVIGDRLHDDFVVEVSSGTPADERGLMVLQIMSRARYERLGYAMYPAYESLYADDDFSDHARADGVVIDGKHLVFPHLHFTFGKADVDDVYRHQNRVPSMELGLRTYLDRKRNGFTI